MVAHAPDPLQRSEAREYLEHFVEQFIFSLSVATVEQEVAVHCPNKSSALVWFVQLPELHFLQVELHKLLPSAS